MLTRQMALTGLTEGYGQISARQANVYKEKLQNSVKCINLLLGSWSGEWFPRFDPRCHQFEFERPRRIREVPGGPRWSSSLGRRLDGALRPGWDHPASIITVQRQRRMRCSQIGLIYLCMDQYRAVKSLVSSLLVPVADMRVSHPVDRRADGRTLYLIWSSARCTSKRHLLLRLSWTVND